VFCIGIGGRVDRICLNLLSLMFRVQRTWEILDRVGHVCLITGHYNYSNQGGRRDRMVVGFITTYAISVYHY